MKKPGFSFLLLLIVLAGKLNTLHKQIAISSADKLALEAIVLEKYHVADSLDVRDTLGGALELGATTYRIYVDLKPGYTLQVVYGNQNHELRLQTSTKFYNNTQCGALIGYNVNSKKINNSNYALDSWLTINSASNNHAGILLAEDKDGSILTRKSMQVADGLTNGNLPVIKPFNMDFTCFKDGVNANLFSTKNGGWAAISGIKAGAVGPTPDNKILIAQLTTTGRLSYELNIQVGTPSGGTLNYVAKNAQGNEIQFDALTRKGLEQ
jgi:hypothetical protein